VVNVVQSVNEEVIVIWVNNGGGAATQTVTNTVTVTAGSNGAAAAVATHSVVVGGTAGLVYDPETIEAMLEIWSFSHSCPRTTLPPNLLLLLLATSFLEEWILDSWPTSTTPSHQHLKWPCKSP